MLFLSFLLLVYILVYTYLLAAVYLSQTLFSVQTALIIMTPAAGCLFIYIICLKRIRRDHVTRNKRKNVIQVLLLFVIPIFCVFLTAGNTSKTAFTNENWKENTAYRELMFEDFERDNDLRGASKEEVKELFGDPTSIEGNRYIYYLGTERGFVPIDSSILKMDFNKNGNIEQYQVVTE